MAISIVAALWLGTTLIRGYHPYPNIGRAYPRGPHAGWYWAAVVGEIAVIVAGIGHHFSN